VAPPTQRLTVFTDTPSWRAAASIVSPSLRSAPAIQSANVSGCPPTAVRAGLVPPAVVSWIAAAAPWPRNRDVSASIPEAALNDRDLVKVIGSALIPALEGRRLRERLRWLFKSFADPNDWRLTRANAVGLRVVPLTTRGRQRMGTRERDLETALKYPDRLRIELDALGTRVLFD